MIKSLYWTTLSAIGLTAGVASALLVGDPVSKVVGMMLVTPILTGLVGAILGAAQLLPLRQLARVSAPKWLLATTLGLCAGLAAGVVLVEQTGRLVTGAQVHVLQLGMPARALSFAVLGLVSGAFLGLAQSLVLRTSFPRLRHWAAISSLALAAGFAVASLLVDAVIGRGLSSPVGLLTFLLASGCCYGALTSRPLRRVGP